MVMSFCPLANWGTSWVSIRVADWASLTSWGRLVGMVRVVKRIDSAIFLSSVPNVKRTSSGTSGRGW